MRLARANDLAGDVWSRVESFVEFSRLFVDRELARDQLRFTIHADGRICGRVGGEGLSGTWSWSNRYFCRAATLGHEDLGTDCEIIETDGFRMRYRSVSGLDAGTIVRPQAPTVFVRLQVRYKGKTGKPVGIFGACHHLSRAGRLSDEDAELFKSIDRWFTTHLPELPFYSDGNPGKAVTYFKMPAATQMLQRLEPLEDLLRRYGVAYDFVALHGIVNIVYQDDVQVAVV